MSTKKKEPNYQAYMQQTVPNRNKKSGLQEREARREFKTQKEKITIRIDQSVLDEFKRLVPEGKGYQNLINQALREWLAAQGVKELVREELNGLVGLAVESIKDVSEEISKQALLLEQTPNLNR
jgi:uncharacterized protein (DUF4415 family)